MTNAERAAKIAEKWVYAEKVGEQFCIFFRHDAHGHGGFVDVSALSERNMRDCENVCRDALAADILAASEDAVRGEREENCLAIRAACSACDNGVYAESPQGDAIECEYCGRPMAAIRARPAK